VTEKIEDNAHIPAVMRGRRFDAHYGTGRPDLAYLRAAAACCSPNGRREESAISSISG
jgi:hypothetical protein